MIVKLIEENNNMITLKPAGDSDKASGDKYKILKDNKKSIYGETVYRIQALKDFTCQGREVAKDSIGGYVASEDNLSQSGTCWIFDEAAVFDGSVVKDDAKVAGFATLIYGDSRIENSAVIESGTIYHCNVKDKAAVLRKCTENDLRNGNNDDSYITVIMHEENILLGSGRSTQPNIIDSIIGGNSKVCATASLDRCTVVDSAVIYGGHITDSEVRGNAILITVLGMNDCTVNNNCIIAAGIHKNTVFPEGTVNIKDKIVNIKNKEV